MPNQSMAGKHEIIRHTEVDELIGQSEVVPILFGMDYFAFHTILGYDGIELLQHQPRSYRIYSGSLIAVDYHTD